MADIDLGQIAQRHGIRLLLLFGSTVSGQVHERSDVDLGVVVDQPSLGLRQYGKMARRFVAQAIAASTTRG